MSMLLRRKPYYPSPPSSCHKLLLRLLPSQALSSASEAASPPPPPPIPLHPLLNHHDHPLFEESAEIANSFKQWFKSSNSPPTLIDQIYQILSSTPDGPPLDSALSSLNLRLSEGLVLSTLKHKPHPSSLLLPNPHIDGSSSSNSNNNLLLLLRLRFFDWAGGAGGPIYRHTLSAYHSIFKILSRAGQVSCVIQWLDQLSEDLHARARFRDTLVVGYAVAGRPEHALRLFAKMRFRGLDLDPFSYHVLLNSFVDAGLFEFEEMLVGQIGERGFRGPVTECIRMKSLCKQGRLDDGIGLLAELQESDDDDVWDGIAIATATLVHALCRNGRFDEAVALVEEIGAHEAYAVWASNLVQAGKVDSAIRFLTSKKSSEGYSVGDVHYNQLISRLLMNNQLEQVYDVLVEMMEEGIVPSRVTMNAALCLFCKAGMVGVALMLYRSRQELGITPSKWVYSHLISALCKNGSIEEVCQLLEESMQEGYFPRKQVFSILANTLCREGRLKMLHELLDGACERAVKPTAAVLARCISSLCKHGELEKAWSVRHMFCGGNIGLGRHKYVYTGLIRAFISLRKVDVLPELIIQMQEAGHSPSRGLYLAVVSSLCEMGKFEEVLDLLNKQLDLLNKRLDLEVSDPRTFCNYFIDGAAHAKNLEMAVELCNRMESAGVKANLDTRIILLRGYLKSKRISNAIEFFCYLCAGREPSTRLYNIFITGLCEVGQVEQALGSWREMRDKRLTPSLQCYEELVLSLCTKGDYDNVVRVLEDLRKSGRPISSFICNVLLLHTLKGKELLRAWVDFNKGEIFMGTMGSGLFLGELIAAFSSGIWMKDNFHNLDEELERSFPMDTYTYNMLLRGLSVAGRMDYACNLFIRMQKKGYKPNLWTYDIIVHGFCKQGKRKEAEWWMEEMYRNGYYPTKYTMRQFCNTI